MTFNVFIDAQAQRDFEGILAWLDVNHPDHANRFIGDFENAVRLLEERPLLRPEVRPGVRHESTRVFKYHLWYRVYPDIEQVEVFAVLHHRRGPIALNERI